MYKLIYFIGIFLLAVFSGNIETFAADHEATLDSGDTAWIISASALVLFMTVPGLALF